MKKTSCLAALGLAALALGMALTGCGQKSGSGSESGPVKLTINITDFPGELETKEWYKKLQKDLNVNLEIVKLDTEQFNLALASGDLPDITILPANSSSLISSIIQADAAVDLTPYLDTKLTNMKLPAYAPINDLMKEFMGGPDHKLYFSPSGMGVDHPEGAIICYRGYIVRWDYYKEIGAPPINNDDDYLAALIAMQARHPATRSGKKTYAIGVEKTFGDMGGYRAAVTRSDIALNVWTFAGTRYATDCYTGQPVNGYTNLERSHYWADMRFYNRVYRAGLFDPDSFSMDFDSYAAKIADGAYMGLYFREDELYPAEVKLDPQTLAMHIPVPSPGAYAFANKISTFGRFPQYGKMIPKTTKNLDKALEVLNWISDPDNNRVKSSGSKGEYWDYDAVGKPYPTEKYFELARSGNSRDVLASGSFSSFDGSALHPDGYYYLLANEGEYKAQSLSFAQQDFCNFYGVTYPAEAQYNLFKQGRVKDLSNDYGQNITSFITLPTDIKRIADTTAQIYERAMPRLIQAKTDTEFLQIQNQVLSDAKAAGEDTVWQWITGEYSRLEKIIYPLFQKAKEYYIHK